MPSGALAVAALAVAAILATASTGSAKVDSATYSNPNHPYTGAATYLYGNAWKRYVGANGHKRTKAIPKLAPVYIGWMNLDDGVNARPALTPIAKMSVWAINNVLGGIQGHRFVLKTCSLHSNEADGQACAQQFANDSSLKAVAVGSDITGGTSFQQAFQGAKPLIVGAATGPYGVNAKNTWALEGSRFVCGVLIKHFVDSRKKIAYLTANTPQLVAVYNQVKAQVDGFGINADMTPVYYDPTATDITPTIIASNLKAYDAIYFVSPSAALCTRPSRPSTKRASPKTRRSRRSSTQLASAPT